MSVVYPRRKITDYGRTGLQPAWQEIGGTLPVAFSDEVGERAQCPLVGAFGELGD